MLGVDSPWVLRSSVGEMTKMWTRSRGQIEQARDAPGKTQGMRCGSDLELMNLDAMPWPARLSLEVLRENLALFVPPSFSPNESERLGDSCVDYTRSARKSPEIDELGRIPRGWGFCFSFHCTTFLRQSGTGVGFIVIPPRLPRAIGLNVPE